MKASNSYETCDEALLK